MENEYEVLTTAVTILPKHEPLFSEMATKIELTDESGGLFVTVSQDRGDDNSREIAIDAGEWDVIRDTIEKMIDVCRMRNKGQEQMETKTMTAHETRFAKNCGDVDSVIEYDHEDNDR